MLTCLLSKIKRGEDVEVYEGSGYRNWLHVDDVVRAIRFCLTNDATPNTITHIGYHQSTRVIDLVNYAIEITGSKSRVTRVPVPRCHQVAQVESFHMDTTKLRSLGFIPELDAYQAVEKVLGEL